LKDKIRHIIEDALTGLSKTYELKAGLDLKKFIVEKPANPEFGHYSVNAAMVYSKDFAEAFQSVKGNKAIELAKAIVQKIGIREDLFDSVEIKGPGFINFRVSKRAFIDLLGEIREKGENYGRRPPTGKRIQAEFVSSNPTGPLHVGHGRGAAWGDAASNILSFLGNEVTREYYVNDAGNQVRKLGVSVLKRLMIPEGPLPEGLYQGAYIKDIADELKAKHPETYFQREEEELVEDLSREAAEITLKDMRGDLDRMGVRFDVWFSEKSLYENHDVEKAIEILKNNGRVYEKDGALFFRSTDLGDDKDRVLIKSNGERTYFASDVAYHLNKFQRGFDLVIDVLGADHAGYLGRMYAMVEALGYERDRLRIVLYQLVRLTRGGEILRMSIRAGEFIPLKVVLDEVSSDAARFLYLSQSHDSTLDFDLELAKKKNNDNPVYYVQYLCARIFQVMKKAEPLLMKHPGEPDFNLLGPEELELIIQLSSFPDMVQSAGQSLSPHLMTVWLMETARLFHHYYMYTRMVDETNPNLTRARVAAAETVRGVVAIGLRLLGISVPERMDKEEEEKEGKEEEGKEEE
jgi:arginyl-tRNA synthetase